MFFEEWLYYGFLTILVEVIIYLSAKLAMGELEEYRKKKFLGDNPEIASLLEEEPDIKIDPAALEEIPLVSYLVYPKNLDINTENTCVVTTLNRAEEFAESGDGILQVMFYPPNEEERGYHKTQQARLERASVIYKLFIMTEEENNDD